jgi:hypothetical protein
MVGVYLSFDHRQETEQTGIFALIRAAKQPANKKKGSHSVSFVFTDAYLKREDRVGQSGGPLKKG